MSDLSVYDERATSLGLTGDKVACTLLAGGGKEPAAQVTIEVHLPPGVSADRYADIKSEVASSAEYLARSVT